MPSQKHKSVDGLTTSSRSQKRRVAASPRRVSSMQKKQRTQQVRTRIRVSTVGNNYKKQIAIITSIFIVVAVTVSGIIWHNNRGRVLGVEESVAITIPLYYTEALVASRGEQALTVTPKKGKRVPVEQDGNTFIYRDAYKNTDVLQTQYTFKVKEELVFHADGHPTSFTYELGNYENYVIEEDADGNIIFYDRLIYQPGEDNNLARVFTIPTPFIEDARQQRSFSAVKTVIDDGELTVKIDSSWLASAQYPLMLDPTLEIQVLNVHSHPQKGDDWIVDFTTQGQGDLYIYPDDLATVHDDEFVSLQCGDEFRNPEILENDTLYYPSWYCEGVGRVIHYTKKAGRHTLRFEFGDQISYAHNAAVTGDFMIRRNDAETTGITTSAQDLTWDTEVVSGGTSITYADGDFTLAAGRYLIMWSERVDGDNTDPTNNQRTEVQGRITINGTATTTAAGQAYQRNGETSCPTDCQYESVISGAGILEIESDDTVVTTSFYRTDSTGASIAVNRVPDWGGVSIIALDPAWDYARYELSSETATVDAFADVVWDTTIEEETGFSRTGADITISSAGQYLVTYTIPITTNSGSDRTEYVTRLRLNDTTEITGTRVSSYMRQSQSTDDGVLSYVGIIDVSASDVLDVEMDATDGTITSDNMEARSSIQLLKLPANAASFILEATATGDMDASTLTEYTWETTAHIDESGFTDTSAIDAYVETATSGLFLLFATQATDNGQTRRSSSARFSLDDTVVDYAAGGQYNRGSGADDAGYSFGALVSGVTSSTQIKLENLGLADLTGSQQADYAAMSGLSLRSVGIVSPGNPSFDTDAADFEIWESGSLTWDAGTRVCSATLDDDNTLTKNCQSGVIRPSTTYRVQVVLENIGGETLDMQGAGDYIDHENVKTFWAGTNPTLGACAFNDVNGDNGSTTCSLAWSNTVDARITNTGGGFVTLNKTTGSEGFMYTITTDSDVVTDATGFFNTSIDGETEDSSKMQIYAPPDLEQLHYRWRFDNGGEGNWFDVSWGYRKQIMLSGSSGAGTNYQVEFDVGYSSGGDLHCGGNCKTDFSDIRFTAGDGMTELDHWREDYTDSTSATFWVEVKADLDSSSNIYMYYGNGAATTASNATNTALFWDDFDGTSLDGARWDTSSGNPPAGDWSVESGYLKMWQDWGGYCAGSGVYNRLNTQDSFTAPIAVETRFRIVGTDAIGNTNICYNTTLGDRDVINLSGPTYESVFRINTSYTSNAGTGVPAKDTWYRVSKYFEDSQLRAITDYGVDATYAGSVINSGVVGLSGDTDAGETNMSDQVDWIFIRKYISPEPAFSSAGSEVAFASVSGASFNTAEDTGLSNFVTASTTRLRFLVSNEGEKSTSTVFQLEVAKAATCSSGSYSQVPLDSSSDWKIERSTYITGGGDDTSNIADQTATDALTDPLSGNTFAFGALRDDQSTTTAITLETTEFTEIEFSLQAVDGNAESGAQYCFRLTNGGDDQDFTYTTYAIATMESTINTTAITHTSTGAAGPIAAGQDIYWSATWSDPDPNEMIKVVVCKTDAISSGACTGGTWCTSPTLTNRNPEGLCKHTAQLGEASDTPYSYYLFVCDDEDNCTNSTTSTFTISNQAPNAPSSPLVENMPNPVNIATTTPRFSSIYEDDNRGDTANKYCVEVNDQPDFEGTDMWASDSDSCNTGVALTSCIQSNRCQDIYYDGTALTLNNTTYYWRMWYWDDEGTISDTSTAATFTTANGSGSSPRGVRMTGFDLKGGVRLK